MFHVLTLLMHKIKAYGPELSNIPEDTSIGSVRLLSLKSNEYFADRIYVCQADAVRQLFRTMPERAKELYYMVPAEEAVRKELALQGGHYIFLDAGADTVMVLSELQDEMMELAQWEMELERIILRHGSVQDIAEASQQFVSGLTTVWNANYSLVSLPDNDADNALTELIPYIRSGELTQQCVEGTLDYSSIRSYDVEGITDISLPCGGTTPCMIHHVFRGVHHAYTVVLFHESREYLAGKRQIISYYFKKLEELLLGNTEKSVADNVFESFLRSIVDGSVTERQKILERATDLGLPIDDEYLFYVVKLKEFSITKARFFIENLRQTLPYEPIIIYREYICILKRTNIPKCKTHNGQLSFENHLENYDAVCGISRKLSSLLDCRSAYFQAYTALKYGSMDPVHEGDMPRVYYYKDYAYYFALSLYEERTGNLNSILPGNIQALYAENRKDTELMETIAAYISNGMSTTATANAMGLHRNTVINRINRLKEEYDIDLKNGESIFGLLMLRHIERYLSTFKKD